MKLYNMKKFFGYIIAGLRYKVVKVEPGLTLPAIYVSAGLNYAEGDPSFIQRGEEAFLIYDRKYKVCFVF